MRTLIEFLRDVKAQKRGAEDYERMKPLLSEEESELIEVVFELMADVAHWACEQGICSIGAIIEAKDSDNTEVLVKALSIGAKFGINPLHFVKIMKMLNVDIKPLDLLHTLSELQKEEEPTPQPEADFDDIQQELLDEIKKHLN